MNWVFVLIAFTSQGAVVERVGLDSPVLCAAYGKGYTERPEMRGAHIQLAQCVGLRSGVVIPLAAAQDRKQGANHD